MSKKTKRKTQMGRPPMPASQAKSRKVFFRAEPPFHAKIEAAAKQAGKPVATWIHDTLESFLGSE